MPWQQQQTADATSATPTTHARPSMNKQDPAESFFETEKQRLIGEINSVCLVLS